MTTANKNGARKAVKENSSGAAGQPYTSYGPSIENDKVQSWRVGHGHRQTDRQTDTHTHLPGLSLRGKKRVRNANRNEPSRERSLLHDQDMDKTQDHRTTVKQRSAVGGGWWLVAVGGWRLAAGDSWRWAVAGGWRRLVVGGDWWLVAISG